MTGIEDYNFPAFHAATERLRKAGHTVFSPAEADLEEFGTLDNVKKYATYKMCLKKDLDWIFAEAEGIYLLKGWEKSRGANIEKAVAEVLGLEVMYEY